MNQFQRWCLVNNSIQLMIWYGICMLCYFHSMIPDGDYCERLQIVLIDTKSISHSWFMLHDYNTQPNNNAKKTMEKLYIYIDTYYQCPENGICRNGFDGFRLYHDSITSDSLKRSRRFHTITCWGLFQRRSQTVSDGLGLYICFLSFFVV